ncbi:MAG TPA: hypothetical protein VLI54_01950 [Bacillota bacterium]|nr:hypothetical protein [Bacillota bacterium]HSX36558.1 hypothetical protein [Patescibacteria group bacterium]
MDPQLEKSPGLALPQPSVEQGGVANGDFQGTYSAPEAASAAPEMAPVPAASVVATGMSSGAPQAVPQIPLQPAALQPAASASSATADDDSDDLDEEWVKKAKAIVERTKEDPFTESKELSKAKADYLRIRYNKQLKVAEEHQ